MVWRRPDEGSAALGDVLGTAVPWRVEMARPSATFPVGGQEPLKEWEPGWKAETSPDGTRHRQPTHSPFLKRNQWGIITSAAALSLLWCGDKAGQQLVVHFRYLHKG